MIGYGKTTPVEHELPESVRITPSKISAWRASKARGARFTYRQIDVMKQAAIDPAALGDDDVVRCRSTISKREMWWPDTDSNPVYVFDCPILEIRPNGFRLVIAPAGDRKIVHESGRLKAGQ